MRLALRELVRRPGRFAVAGGALTLLAVLLLLLGGLLDGLFLGSTGAIRAQRADVFVYSADSRESIIRSRITPELRAEVDAVDGVQSTGGLGVALLGADVAETGEPVDVAVIGYESPPAGVPDPPPAGEAWADDRLEADGVEVGDTLEVGPAAVPVRVAGFVSDTSYVLQGSLWVEAETWRTIQTSSRPGAAVSDGVFQILLVDADEGVAADVLAERIDETTAGATTSLTKDEAVLSLPGTSEQQGVFNALIGATIFVAGLVSALFFALITIERTSLLATLKAIGAGSGRLLAGLVTQAVVITAGAFLVGSLVTLGLAQIIPDTVPVRFEPSRGLVAGALLIITAAVGSALSLRRIVRIDPASAIG